MTDETVKGKIRQSDIAGVMIFVVATVLFAYGIQGFNQWGWITAAALSAGLVVTGRVISIRASKDSIDINGGSGDNG